MNEFAQRGFQGQIVVADVLLFLEFLKHFFGGRHVFEGAQVPEALVEKFFLGVPQQFDQEGVDVDDLARGGVENQDSVAGRLEQAAVALFEKRHLLLDDWSRSAILIEASRTDSSLFLTTTP